MRSNEVNSKLNDGYARFYYCDHNVDFVLAKLTKPFISERHKHTSNTESYYVFKGTLVLHIEDNTEVLNSGDMVVIYPGVTHCFETCTADEVVFCALKKQPLLEDKELS